MALALVSPERGLDQQAVTRLLTSPLPPYYPSDLLPAPAPLWPGHLTMTPTPSMRNVSLPLCPVCLCQRSKKGVRNNFNQFPFAFRIVCLILFHMQRQDAENSCPNLFQDELSWILDQSKIRAASRKLTESAEFMRVLCISLAISAYSCCD